MVHVDEDLYAHVIAGTCHFITIQDMFVRRFIGTPEALVSGRATVDANQAVQVFTLAAGIIALNRRLS